MMGSKRGRRRYGLAAVPVVALGAALMAAAGTQAATMSTTGDGFSYVYNGDAGANNVSVRSDGNPVGEVSFTEFGDGLTITMVPASCTLPVAIRADCSDLPGDAGDFVNLGEGDDRFSAPGGEANANAYFAVGGNPGDDVLRGGVRQDLINGGADDDVIDGEPPRSLAGRGDVLDGADGVDTVSYDDVYHGFTGVTVDLAAGTGGVVSEDDDEGDELSNFENILGSIGPDTLIGDDGDNEIDGNRGKDTIESGDGDDVVTDASGKSSVDCGPGKDKATVLKKSKVKKCEKVKFL